MYQEFCSGIDGETLHGKLYEGIIARFRHLEPMQELIAFTQDFLSVSFRPYAPVEIHRHFTANELAAALTNLRRDFARSEDIRRLWRAVFESAGLDLEGTARDRFIVRFQPPDLPTEQRSWARSTATMGFHRDTWGTNLYAQINWWAPVYPLDARRTMSIFPKLFARPLANNSYEFDISEVMNRKSGASDRVDLVPRPSEAIDMTGGVPVLIAPGEVIAFSAQHAHCGVRNVTDLTRISLDTRTLRIADHLAGRGAVNVDGRARWMTPGMFKRLSDDHPLTKVLGVEPLQQFDPDLP